MDNPMVNDVLPHPWLNFSLGLVATLPSWLPEKRSLRQSQSDQEISCGVTQPLYRLIISEHNDIFKIVMRTLKYIVQILYSYFFLVRKFMSSYSLTLLSGFDVSSSKTFDIFLSLPILINSWYLCILCCAITAVSLQLNHFMLINVVMLWDYYFTNTIC